MNRQFRTVDYEQTLDTTIRLGDVVPEDHLARFVVDVIAQLDLSALYARYRSRGGAPYAPEVLLGLLFYGYATGVFSTRKIERATYESVPFCFIAGNLHPDHDTVAAFRTRFLGEIKELFVQILLIAQAAEVLKLGNISLDGTKLRANASKSKAVSHKRLLEIEAQLKQEVKELFALAEATEGGALPDGLVIEDEIGRREVRLARLAEAKEVLEERAAARYAEEQAAHAAKLAAREEKARRTGRKPGGRPPGPPEPGVPGKEQYNFTDPDGRMMKNSTDAGFNQSYNGQVAVDQDSLLIVGASLSNHANDQHEVEPTLAAIPEALGTPDAAALDNGYFSQKNIDLLEARGIDPYIATGRDGHNKSWQARFAESGEPPDESASAKEKMAHKLRTEKGRSIYGARKHTVEPVLGIIKAVMGFRQCSLRGMVAVTGEWYLVCLAFNLRRLHRLQRAECAQ